MEIRNGVDGLKTLPGVNPADPAAQQGKSNGTPAAGNGFETDRATVSDAASEMSQAASDEGVRAEKVAAIQAALAAGTYHVPAAAVASKLVDAMLADGQ
jgi:negative regulator of flagellin synthesis FlgM